MRDRRRFEQLVARALDRLPPWVAERLDNVEILVEDRPEAGEPNLLGIYRGIPLTERGMDYAGVLPDTITLFRLPIEAEARSDRELEDVVRRTVAHEIAHFFGIDDERLHELDAY